MAIRGSHREADEVGRDTQQKELEDRDGEPAGNAKRRGELSSESAGPSGTIATDRGRRRLSAGGGRSTDTVAGTGTATPAYQVHY